VDIKAVGPEEQKILKREAQISLNSSR